MSGKTFEVQKSLRRTTFENVQCGECFRPVIYGELHYFIKTNRSHAYPVSYAIRVEDNGFEPEEEVVVVPYKVTVFDPEAE